MAKLEGILKLVGTIQGLTIYQTQDGYVVKKKWGPSKARLKSDPAYKAVRLHQVEFGTCTKAAKLLRDTLMPVLEGSLDNRVSPRLNKVMNAVKNLDKSSMPGKRVVSKGFGIAEGRVLLKGFQFNIHSHLSQLLIKPYSADFKGTLRFKGFSPKKDLRCPKGATHVVLQCGLAIVDFETKKSMLREDSVVLPLISTAKELVLNFKSTSKIKGLKVLVLKVAFLQEVNGTQHALGEGRYNAVGVVDVWV